MVTEEGNGNKSHTKGSDGKRKRQRKPLKQFRKMPARVKQQEGNRRATYTDRGE